MVDPTLKYWHFVEYSVTCSIYTEKGKLIAEQVSRKNAKRIVNAHNKRADKKYAKHAFDKMPKPCILCGEAPTVRATEMCGPCTFGEAETLGGNW